MNDQQRNPAKSISEQLQDALALLTPNQLRFVVAWSELKSKKEAAEAIGMEPDTVYRWNGNVEEARRLIDLEREMAAREISKSALVKAVMVKLAGLDSNDETIRQKVATEIIEMNLGKPSAELSLNGSLATTVNLAPRFEEALRRAYGDDEPEGA